ncbi:hypothetical protein EMUCRT_0530 [Ehrlichia cf. muris str. EmCRT]|uniref:Uncharacterized protein n=1 Tax=Ehrlichia cf. muris str. EmCRT TaxID=1359167 RepID=A0A0F3NC39_9RICK|nr:hypothetical protein EMUCRT_0530 [Ehrlichia cf. muris str. EmCRT]
MIKNIIRKSFISYGFTIEYCISDKITYCLTPDVLKTH